MGPARLPSRRRDVTPHDRRGDSGPARLRAEHVLDARLHPGGDRRCPTRMRLLDVATVRRARLADPPHARPQHARLLPNVPPNVPADPGSPVMIYYEDD